MLQDAGGTENDVKRTCTEASLYNTFQLQEKVESVASMLEAKKLT